MKNKENLLLIEKAYEAMTFAYSPYSGFQVGAAVLTESGKIYTGCNIENASYGATNCAERTAMFKAISEGETKFLKIAIVSSSKDQTYPCGICRQVMAEFMPKGQVILADENRHAVVYEMNEVMPLIFDSELPNKQQK